MLIPFPRRIMSPFFVFLLLDLWSTNLKLVKTETPTLAQALYPLTGAIHVK